MLRAIPRQPRKIAVRELRQRLAADGFSTTSRTIERDLQRLSQQFPLVSDTSGKPYGWCWAKDANFEFLPRISASQGVALLLARTHLGEFLPRSMLHDLAPLFEIAEKEIAPTGWNAWHRRTALLPSTVTLRAPPVAPAVLETVHQALAQGRCLTARYRAKGGVDAKEMPIHPLGLIVRGQVQYLVCTLRDYPDVRHLALHRFETAMLLDAPCVEPPGFRLDRYLRSTGSKYRARGEIRLVARFAAPAAEHLRDARLADDQTITALPCGEKVELAATVEDDDTLRWWLLGFGRRVEVLAPAALRDALRAELSDALAAYG